ncbi:uncharacterized protein CLUP02_05596 [Colletotrichum lupini]|uniref:Uncharacterized protein n=1 Tax=Colletotrichum lupini TaxID=145971 RepID=A0A9Q8SMI6_9PEZI|nr:uncharacterized protein CLUP02_05596 [Colletotrichum lupini]UQC80114.1 hypothetical protein CLUP02_05596 [Colletotrichum lupini]
MPPFASAISRPAAEDAVMGTDLGCLASGGLEGWSFAAVSRILGGSRLTPPMPMARSLVLLVANRTGCRGGWTDTGHLRPTVDALGCLRRRPAFQYIRSRPRTSTMSPSLPQRRWNATKGLLSWKIQTFAGSRQSHKMILEYPWINKHVKGCFFVASRRLNLQTSRLAMIGAAPSLVVAIPPQLRGSLQDDLTDWFRMFSEAHKVTPRWKEHLSFIASAAVVFRVILCRVHEVSQQILRPDVYLLSVLLARPPANSTSTLSGTSLKGFQGNVTVGAMPSMACLKTERSSDICRCAYSDEEQDCIIHFNQTPFNRRYLEAKKVHLALEPIWLIAMIADGLDPLALDFNPWNLGMMRARRPRVIKLDHCHKEGSPHMSVFFFFGLPESIEIRNFVPSFYLDSHGISRDGVACSQSRDQYCKLSGVEITSTNDDISMIFSAIHHTSNDYVTANVTEGDHLMISAEHISTVMADSFDIISIYIRLLTQDSDPYSLKSQLRRGSPKHSCLKYLTLFSMDPIVSKRNTKTRSKITLSGKTPREMASRGKLVKLKSFQWQGMATVNLIGKHMNTEKDMMALTNMPSFPRTTRPGTTTIRNSVSSHLSQQRNNEASMKTTPSSEPRFKEGEKPAISHQHKTQGILRIGRFTSLWHVANTSKPIEQEHGDVIHLWMTYNQRKPPFPKEQRPDYHSLSPPELTLNIRADLCPTPWRYTRQPNATAISNKTDDPTTTTTSPTVAKISPRPRRAERVRSRKHGNPNSSRNGLTYTHTHNHDTIKEKTRDNPTSRLKPRGALFWESIPRWPRPPLNGFFVLRRAGVFQPKGDLKLIDHNQEPVAATRLLRKKKKTKKRPEQTHTPPGVSPREPASRRRSGGRIAGQSLDTAPPLRGNAPHASPRRRGTAERVVHGIPNSLDLGRTRLLLSPELDEPTEPPSQTSKNPIPLRPANRHSGTSLSRSAGPPLHDPSVTTNPPRGSPGLSVSSQELSACDTDASSSQAAQPQRRLAWTARTPPPALRLPSSFLPAAPYSS